MAGDPGRDVVYKRSNAWRPIDQLQSTEKPRDGVVEGLEHLAGHAGVLARRIGV